MIADDDPDRDRALAGTEVVVDDPARRHAKLDHGGTLVDVGLRDRTDEDQFARLIPIANLSQRVLVGYDAIRAEVDAADGRARPHRPPAAPRRGVWCVRPTSVCRRNRP